MARAKLPPYGRELVEMRNAGNHPGRVWVIVGDDWSRRPANAPSLFVPAGANPAIYDWTILAGLPVHVVDRAAGNAIGVAVAVAQHAAPVTLHWRPDGDSWPYEPGKPAQQDISNCLYTLRQPDRDGYVWTHGWSDAIEADYQRRRMAYFNAVVADAVGDRGAVA